MSEIKADSQEKARNKSELEQELQAQKELTLEYFSLLTRAEKEQEDLRQELQAKLQDKKNSLTKLQKKLQDKEQALAEIQEKLDSQKQLTLRYYHSLAQAEAEQDRLRSQIEQKDSENRQLQNWMQGLHKEFQALLGSRRWRLGHALGRIAGIPLLRSGEPHSVKRIQHILSVYQSQAANGRIASARWNQDQGKLLFTWMEQLVKILEAILCSRRWRAGNGLVNALSRVIGHSRQAKSVIRMQDILEQYRRWRQGRGSAPLTIAEEKQLREWMQQLEADFRSLQKSRRWKLGKILATPAVLVGRRPGKSSGMNKAREIFQSYDQSGLSSYSKSGRSNLYQKKQEHDFPRDREAARLEEKLKIGYTSCAISELKHRAQPSEGDGGKHAHAAWILATYFYGKETYQPALEYVELCEPWCKNQKGRYKVALLKAECFRAIGDLCRAREAIDALKPKDKEQGSSLDLIRNNILCDDCIAGTPRTKWLNRIYARHGLLQVEDSCQGELLIDDLYVDPWEEDKSKKQDQPRVSVIMPVYNAEGEIGTALESLRDQTWQNLEVIVVDDKSRDKTMEKASQFADSFSSFRLLQSECNSGPYFCRNLALQYITGDFVTVHDSDDWSHPQKIETQASQLIANPQIGFNMTYWVRIDKSNHVWLLANRFKLEPLHRNYSSVMLRTRDLIHLGGWDTARANADSELVERLWLRFGANKEQELLSYIPFALGRASKGQLTQHSLSGINTVFYGARAEYKKNFKFWHSKCAHNQESLTLHRHSRMDPFPVPKILWDGEPRRQRVEVVLLSDLSLQGGTATCNLNFLETLLESGKSVLIVDWPRFDLAENRKRSPKLQHLINQGRVEVACPGDVIEAEVLLVNHPPVLARQLETAPSIRAQNILVVVNQLPSQWDPPREFMYDPLSVEALCGHTFGGKVTWVPISPKVRRYMEQDGRFTAICSLDWYPVMQEPEPSARTRNRPDCSSKKVPTLGRHCSDLKTKWPNSKEDLEASFCAETELPVVIQGGSRKAEEVLGYLPTNWEVRPFESSGDLEYFFERIDIFVHFCHENYIEEFGRNVLEAMARGIPAILHPSLEETFGKGNALYVEPKDVYDTAMHLWRSPERYRELAERGRLFHHRYCRRESVIHRLQAAVDEMNSKSGLREIRVAESSGETGQKRTGIDVKNIKTDNRNLIKQGSPEAFNKKMFHVNWSFTAICNYNCHYCFHRNKNIKENKFISTEDYLKIVKKIRSIEKDSYTVAFAGGEPTLHPGLQQVIDSFCCDENCAMTIITNFSRSLSFYRRLCKDKSQEQLKLNVSIHLDHAKLKDTIDKLKALEPFIAGVNIMAHPLKMNYVKNFYYELSSIAELYKLNVSVKVIRYGGLTSPEYRAEDLEWIKNLEPIAYRQNNDLKKMFTSHVHTYYDKELDKHITLKHSINDKTIFTLDSFKNMFCSAGNIIRINNDGTCQQGICKSYDVKFNIIKNDIPKEFFNPVICRQNRCSCGANHFAPKFIKFNDSPSYFEKSQLLSSVQNFLMKKRKLVYK